MSSIYVFDPTVSDPLSQVRGIGRYLKLLKENFKDEFIFTDKLTTHDSRLMTTFVNPFFDPLKTPLLMKRVAKKQIGVIHDLIPLKYPSHFPTGMRGKLNIFLNKLALKNYDLIITDSEASKKDIINILKIKKEKIKIIYPTLSSIFLNPTDQKKSLGNLDFGNCDLFGNWNLEIGNYFIYVGDATWNKNLVNIAKAIKLADVTCIFVGKVFQNNSKFYSHPWQKELKEFLELTANDKHFIFPGFVTDEELISLYKNAVANILVSRDEGFGFSYFEAATQGTPSILGDIPIFRETAGNTSLFADPENPQAIAKEFKKISSDEKIRSELGKESKERVLSFSKERFKNDFLNALNFD